MACFRRPASTVATHSAVQIFFSLWKVTVAKPPSEMPAQRGTAPLRVSQRAALVRVSLLRDLPKGSRDIPVCRVAGHREGDAIGNGHGAQKHHKCARGALKR